MTDPRTLWLTVTNIALGVFVAACFLIVVVGLFIEILRRPGKRRRDRAELDRDMHEMFGLPQPRGHRWLHHNR